LLDAVQRSGVQGVRGVEAKRTGEIDLNLQLVFH